MRLQKTMAGAREWVQGRALGDWHGVHGGPRKGQSPPPPPLLHNQDFLTWPQQAGQHR
jgi:hypothetical protein